MAELIRTVVNNHPHSTNPKRYLWKMVRAIIVLRSSREKEWRGGPRGPRNCPVS